MIDRGITEYETTFNKDGITINAEDESNLEI